ncbi:hypothetical protein Q4S45_04100 [Massilia sp. R2A-15]|uniref:hypothetical protein n=1 Tax=Massilia sp. R2A-15 TaxID=3064278 RepID=UPI0027375AB6|nr:hypothetical protein [Massilia sp. R2A-15]WLI90314.1 hypothetical protein Q4S45_04100 [Massilia sp. R2A-15]
MSNAITVLPLSAQDELALDGCTADSSSFILQVHEGMSPQLRARLRDALDELGILYTLVAVDLIAAPQAPVPATL